MQLLTNWFLTGRETAVGILWVIAWCSAAAMIVSLALTPSPAQQGSRKGKTAYYAPRILCSFTAVIFAITMAMILIGLQYCETTTYYQGISSVETCVDGTEGIEYQITASDGAVYRISQENVTIQECDTGEPYGEFEIYNIQEQGVTIAAKQVILHINKEDIQHGDAESV